jgi:phosphatidylglycerophosphatase C
MGDNGEPRQTQGLFRPIVAFDFDGTLTSRDSFIAFLQWKAGMGRFVASLVGLSPSMIAYLFHRDRGRLKARFARAFLGGLSQDEIAAHARRFAEAHARKLLRPDAVRSWKRWQGAGARMVIVTASPEIVIAPFARGLGADALLGTRLEFNAAGRFTGRLDGANCRGEEKVRRLREAFGDDVRLEAAYGDTGGDLAMLGLADEQGMRVFKGTA